MGKQITDITPGSTGQSVTVQEKLLPENDSPDRDYGIQVREYLPPDPSRIKNPDPECRYYWDSIPRIQKEGMDDGYELVRDGDREGGSVDPESRRLAGTDVPRGRTIPSNVITNGDLVLTKCHEDYAKSREKFFLEKDREHVKGTQVLRGKDASDMAEQRMKDEGLSRKEIDKRLVDYRGGAKENASFVVMNR